VVVQSSQRLQQVHRHCTVLALRVILGDAPCLPSRGVLGDAFFL
jgi:hypothetical protein